MTIMTDQAKQRAVIYGCVSCDDLEHGFRTYSADRMYWLASHEKFPDGVWVCDLCYEVRQDEIVATSEETLEQFLLRYRPATHD